MPSKEEFRKRTNLQVQNDQSNKEHPLLQQSLPSVEISFFLSCLNLVSWYSDSCLSLTLPITSSVRRGAVAKAPTEVGPLPTTWCLGGNRAYCSFFFKKNLDDAVRTCMAPPHSSSATRRSVSNSRELSSADAASK